MIKNFLTNSITCNFSGCCGEKIFNTLSIQLLNPPFIQERAYSHLDFAPHTYLDGIYFCRMFQHTHSVFPAGLVSYDILILNFNFDGVCFALSHCKHILFFLVDKLKKFQKYLLNQDFQELCWQFKKLLSKLVHS